MSKLIKKLASYGDNQNKQINEKKRLKLQNKAKTFYAEKEAYAMRLQNPQTNIKQTEVKVENSFNNNLNKQKSTKVSAKAKFSWFGKKK